MGDFRHLRPARFRPAEKLPYVPFTGKYYDGADLRRNCEREGAYVAYDLPSLIGGQRVYPRGVTPNDE